MNRKSITTLMALALLLSAAGTEALGQTEGKTEKSYWIGVVCRPPSLALRQQLGIPKGEGLVVETIAPKSAAEKAGLKRHDIITKIGNTVLKNTGDLRQAVAKSGGEKVAMEILRGGRKQSVSIVPQERAQVRRWERKPVERKEPEKPKTPEKPKAPEKAVKRYRIGIYGLPANADLLKKHDLPEGKGLIVRRVLPDSPAEKAGIKDGDILAEANEKPLVELEDLIKVISKSEGKKIGLVVYRNGEKKQLSVTPELVKDDSGPNVPQLPLPPDPTDRKKIEEWIKKIQPGDMDDNQMRFKIIHPPAMNRALPPIPGNMSVSITKSGKEPAKIVVKRGEEKWEVTEDSLDKLPPDVRPHIEKMLGGVRIQIGGMDGPGNIRPNIRMFQKRLVPDMDVPKTDMDKRMKEMEKKMERLHKLIEEMMRRNREDKGR